MEGNLAHYEFDAEQVDPKVDLPLVPAGYYIAYVDESEVKPTAAGTGELIKLKVKIAEGEHAGRTLYDNINMRNPNAEAVAIGRATLSSICRAAGVLKLRDTAELHGKPLGVRVKHQKRRDTGEMQAVIDTYSKADPAAAGIGQAAPAAAPGGGVPWKRPG